MPPLGTPAFFYVTPTASLLAGARVSATSVHGAKCHGFAVPVFRDYSAFSLALRAVAVRRCLASLG